MNTYRIYYEVEDCRYDEYISGHTAQEAVDSVRNRYESENIEIFDVAKIIKNWK